MQAIEPDVSAGPKPLPSEVDVFGITHPGLVRETNADHFMIARYHRALQVLASNMPAHGPEFSADSRGYVFLVADGVGARAGAVAGSARAIEAVTRQLLDMAEMSLPTEPDKEDEITEGLRAAVLGAHDALVDLGGNGGSGAAATTLTALFLIWPRSFIVHAGDSRCYRLRDGVLERLTSDQTMAQGLVEQGVLTMETASKSPLANVLVSAVGSSQLELQVLVGDLQREDVHLLCSDGLTRHVSDEELGERLRSGGSAEVVCRELLELALERGGKDNITVLMGSAREP
jgi:PPM family protein phosphatase